MKKTFLLIIILLVFFSCLENTTRSCKDFKTGDFTFTYNDNGIQKNGQIIRNDTLQIELFGGKMHKSKVRWVNDCEVIFKSINPKRMIDKNDIHLKILTTTDSSYTFEYSYVGESKKKKGVVYSKIKLKPKKDFKK